MEINNATCNVEKKADGNCTVTLRPSAVAQSLRDKLSSDDILTGQQIVERQRQLMNIPRQLYSKCAGMECSLEHEDFRAIPNGYSNASVMFVSKQPTLYEACSGFSQCDRQAIFFSLILSKLNVTREYVYFTDMVKCYSEHISEQSLRKCTENYLMKEVINIKPKLIICNGLNVLNVWNNLYPFQGLPNNTGYGTIYDVVIAGIPVKIMAIYELNKVLTKTGKDYEDCKKALWHQITSGFRSITAQQQKGDNNGYKQNDTGRLIRAS